MSKGIIAFIVVASVIFSISILSGIGFYDQMNLDYDVDNMDDDTQSALDALTDQSASDTSGNAIVEFTTGASNTLQTAWEVLTNTSGILKLLFSAPDSVATYIEKFFQLVFGITFLGFIRGVRLQ